MSIHALLGRLRGEISRIEAKHQSPGSTRPAAVENTARTVGAPPSPSSVAGGRRSNRDVPPVADPPPATRYLNIDGLTPLQRWDDYKLRLDWLLEYAEQSAQSARSRSDAAEQSATKAERVVEEIREALRRHLAEKPTEDDRAETPSQEVTHVDQAALGSEGGARPKTRRRPSGGAP